MGTRAFDKKWCMEFRRCDARRRASVFVPSEISEREKRRVSGRERASAAVICQVVGTVFSGSKQVFGGYQFCANLSLVCRHSGFMV